MLGMRYPKGYLDNPKNHRTRCSIVLLGPTGNLLVDCAPEMRLQMTREQIYDVEAVLITHTHADHVMGMDDLRSISMRTGIPTVVYARPDAVEDIRRIYPYAFRPMPGGIVVPRFELRNPPSTLHVGGLDVAIFEVMHGDLPVLALRTGGFAYVTDVNAIPAKAEALLQGLDTLILDGVRHNPHPTHFHLAAALEVIERLKPKRTYLTHLSHDYDHDVANREMPAGVELAYDGLRIPL